MSLVSINLWYCTDGWKSLRVNKSKCKQGQNLQTVFFWNWKWMYSESHFVTEEPSPSFENGCSLNWEKNKEFKVDKSWQISMTKVYLSAIPLFLIWLFLTFSFDSLWWKLPHGSIKVKVWLFEINAFIYLPVMTRMTLSILWAEAEVLPSGLCQHALMILGPAFAKDQTATHQFIKYSEAGHS